MANSVLEMLKNIKNETDKLAKKLKIVEKKQKAKIKKPAVKRKKKRGTRA